MRHVTLVTGPPCAGKSTYVRQHAQPEDLVLDRDELDGERQMLAGLQQVAAMSDGCAWVIRCVPDPVERAELAGQIEADDVLVLLPSRNQLKDRAKQRPKPLAQFASIDRWFSRYSPWSGDRVVAGFPLVQPQPVAAKPKLDW